MPQNPVIEPLNLTRNQILGRLWELANLSPELTRGVIAGQVKALAMIIAIEGLIPKPGHDRRISLAPMPSAAKPDPQPAKDAPFPKLDRNQASVVNPFVDPPKMSWVPDATAFRLDAVLDASGPLRLPILSPKSPLARGR
jgi:hypothetical protein